MTDLAPVVVCAICYVPSHFGTWDLEAGRWACPECGHLWDRLALGGALEED